jgi:hypothetical protein
MFRTVSIEMSYDGQGGESAGDVAAVVAGVASEWREEEAGRHRGANDIAGSIC